MKISIEHSKLAEVAKVAAILGDSGFNFTPEYFLALVQESDDAMRAHFQSGAIQASMLLPVLSSSIGHQHGVCIPKNETLRFLSAANGETVNMEVSGNTAKLKAGKSLMKAVTLDIDGFPLPNSEIHCASVIQVSAQSLKAALSLTNVGSSSDSLGTYMEYDDGTLYVYTTDGKALLHSGISASLVSGNPKVEPVSLSMKTALPLAKALGHFECEQVQICFNESDVTFRDPGNMWNIRTLKLADIKPVQWERLLNSETVALCSISDSADMESCLDISTSISNEKKNVVAMSVSKDNTLTMTLSNDRGESQSAFEVTTHAPYQALTSSLYIYAFLGFCRKHGENGSIELFKLNAPSANPLRLSYTGDSRFSSDPTIVIAPYTA